MALTGCGSLSDFLEDYDLDLSDYDPCYASSGDPIDTTGAWSLTGRGERYDCSVEELNTGSFDLSSDGLIDILQDEDGTLSLRNDRGGFVLYGSVDGLCVDFTTTEQGEDLAYDWSGTIDNNIITGSFEGYGPYGCVSEGEFTVIID